MNIYQGKKAVVMPCLIELGKAAKEVHQRIGKKLAQVSDLAIITAKECFETIKKECPQAVFSENPQEIVEKLKGFNAILLEGRISPEIIDKIKCL